MKNICLGCCLLLSVLYACGHKETNSAAVSGKIEGLGNDTLYVYRTGHFRGRMDTLIVRNDKFSATLAVDTLASAWLLFGDGTEHPLFLNKGDRIKISGSAADLSFLDISGNMPNEELTSFRKELKGLGRPSEKALEEKAQAFIESHPTSLASVYLLEKYFVDKPSPDFALIRKLTDPMPGELKDHPSVSRLLTLMSEEEKMAVGNGIPYIHLPNAKGTDISQTSFKEKHVLIHFWASWDEASKEANAALRRIYKKEKKNKAFALWGISLDTDREEWRKVIERDTLKWEQTCDFAGWNSSSVTKLCIHTLPANLLVDRWGRIEGKNLTAEEIEKKLDEWKQQEKQSHRHAH